MTEDEAFEAHSAARRATHAASLSDRFWPKVNKLGPDECWEWTGSMRDGYGAIGVPPDKRLSAHRVAWMVARGPIPDGICVCHSCDNPPCCNPAHLFLGTHHENMRDMIAKGRSKYIAAHGAHNAKAKLSELDVDCVRKCYKTGVFSQAELARAFRISSSQVGRIVRGKNWPMVLAATIETKP